MRTVLTLGFAALACFSCRSAEPTKVVSALMTERLRVEDAHIPGHQLITMAADRFAGYYQLAENQNEAKRLDKAFKLYCKKVMKQIRRKAEDAREEWRRQRLRNSPAERA
jgi:hypothetical protein